MRTNNRDFRGERDVGQTDNPACVRTRWWRGHRLGGCAEAEHCRTRNWMTGRIGNEHLQAARGLQMKVCRNDLSLVHLNRGTLRRAKA